MFPLAAPTINATTNGIVAKSPKGYIATDVAPIFTDMAKGTNVQMPKGSSEISSIDQELTILPP
jgi:PTS system galactitol-specific IIC component